MSQTHPRSSFSSDDDDTLQEGQLKPITNQGLPTDNIEKLGHKRANPGPDPDQIGGDGLIGQARAVR